MGLEVEARSAFSEDSPEDSCQSCLHSGSGGAARWCGSMDDGRLDQMNKSSPFAIHRFKLSLSERTGLSKAGQGPGAVARAVRGRGLGPCRPAGAGVGLFQ